MNKQDYKELGKMGAEKYWEPIRTRKMDILQELYLSKDKQLIDYLTKEKSVNWLERFLVAVKGRRM